MELLPQRRPALEPVPQTERSLSSTSQTPGSATQVHRLACNRSVVSKIEESRRVIQRPLQCTHAPLSLCALRSGTQRLIDAQIPLPAMRVAPQPAELSIIGKWLPTTVPAAICPNKASQLSARAHSVRISAKSRLSGSCSPHASESHECRRSAPNSHSTASRSSTRGSLSSQPRDEPEANGTTSAGWS